MFDKTMHRLFKNGNVGYPGDLDLIFPIHGNFLTLISLSNGSLK